VGRVEWRWPLWGRLGAGTDKLVGEVGLALQQASPSGPYIGTTASPRSNRPRMIAIIRRLAAALCSSAQVGNWSSPARASA
jgi:hypothetical protein